MLRLGFYLLINFYSHFRLLTSYHLVGIRHTFKFLILFHMHHNLLLDQGLLTTILALLHLSYLLISFLLICHLLIIVKLYLFNDNKVLPIDLLRIHCHFLFHIWIKQSFLLSNLLLLSLVKLSLFTRPVDLS